ncbi:ATP-binding protein [Aliivibrio sp. S4TY2]|uniref:ATP-binding protein n=1 Tax=unclassified Aliivibrio TaxID=2645654 RepID=UPI00237948CE|nr:MULTISPECIES: ATP-binding protein [unclassified Aliivibrio]MDD9155433.1 ATP-binding protein [Aliivibrio sp. S4TY2]MDD9161560.1 ATP-binding protein [Aliivibrio sp. S4TY1]MDD9165590.1 ATP-binding protein [Aliivibrio sp. S4MY2]MDD9169589.1 ATP-binding protein [Aliivibrio sp. S4MY4]MDD9186582.1 ATP-binding protein [Aliivibrio sp. S4MY3]
MKRNSIAFKARARTIDHLGKGQIADAPTAVSELWKNSYDAYSRDVALHLFDGPIKCGALMDNGCGMTYEQLMESWLVIGTESKSKKKLLPEEDRFGLKERYTQGEKGIGRLSTAFLAPVTLLVTKKMNTNYSVALIDWRLFENTYLSLNDIKVPMVEISDLSTLPEVCSSLQKDLLENLALKPNEDNFEQVMIRKAWERFSADELDIFQNRENPSLADVFVSTEDKFINFCDNFKFFAEYTQTWVKLLDKVKGDGGEHGTALFLLDLERDLSVLTNSDDLSKDDVELKAIKKDVEDTLRAFVNPFDRKSLDFNYEIVVVDINNTINEMPIINQDDIFDYEAFKALEHKVEGVIDEKGWFRGSVRAFGVEYLDVVLPPNVRVSSNATNMGPIEIKLGTFELELAKSTHSAKEQSLLLKQAEKYSALMIFRDGLRVMPYGRTDNDFFDIEMRRSKNAGRYYWANRRLFGQILLTHKANKNLKDKAGREGFIKNSATRELKSVVESHLLSLADKYFGTKSDSRKEMLAILNKEKEEKKASQKQANRTNLAEFRSTIKNSTPILSEQVNIAREVYQTLESKIDLSFNQFDRLIKTISDVESMRGELKTPSKPAKINEQLEEKFRSYRDEFSELTELVRVSREKLNKLEVEMKRETPVEVVQRKFNSNQGLLNAQVAKYERLIDSKLQLLNLDWKKDASGDRKKFNEEAINILDSITSNSDVETNLNILDSIYVNLADSFTIKYESVLRALDRLAKGINLDSAFSMAEEEKAYFEDKANKLQALAQLGISVEVLAHELEQQDMLVTRGLNSLPSDIKAHPGFKTAFEAHKALTGQIRFLSPLKLSGYQARQEITGEMIERHIKLFFRDRFERQRVDLKITDAFKSISIIDLPSRIYPVFVNIINNALYWVGLSDKRVIEIDLINDLVIIANSGPVIDEDDIPRLFELFYSKRNSGHGVGLYLCRENLAVAHHKIWYAEAEEQKVLSDGANFVIQFNNMEIKNG